MKLPLLPRNIVRIGEDDSFDFACHNGVSCFTDCCCQLDLALTPYDVLRLKNALQLSSQEFLERYVIIEQESDDNFPRLYLTMVDDGRASCVFVTRKGCSVYPDRPGACRAYPTGRAAMRKDDNTLEEFFVLLNEDHCKGFAESQKQTPLQYCRQQGLDKYNEMNDAIAQILQHEKIRQGMRLTAGQIELFLLALYDLDTFRTQLFSGDLDPGPMTEQERLELEDDEKLLSFGIQWLKKKIFANS